eukprot:1671637-Pyramimonas_sp.AAC.1
MSFVQTRATQDGPKVSPGRAEMTPKWLQERSRRPKKPPRRPPRPRRGHPGGPEEAKTIHPPR